MAGKGGQSTSCNQGVGTHAGQALNHKHRHPAFDGIEQQGQHGSRFAARAQHIGGPRVLAAVGARVLQAHHAADDDRKRQ